MRTDFCCSHLHFWKCNCKTPAPSQPSASACPERVHRPQTLIQFPASFLTTAGLLLRLRMIYRNSCCAALPGGNSEGFWRGLWKVVFESILSTTMLWCVKGDWISINQQCVSFHKILIFSLFFLLVWISDHFHTRPSLYRFLPYPPIVAPPSFPILVNLLLWLLSAFAIGSSIILTCAFCRNQCVCVCVVPVMVHAASPAGRYNFHRECLLPSPFVISLKLVGNTRVLSRFPFPDTLPSLHLPLSSSRFIKAFLCY